jgi:RES domain-containing protein
VNQLAWRIVKRKYSRTAFTGEGARLFGGRWTSIGTSVVYTAESQSLAALEMLVHMDSAELLGSYVLFEVSFDSSLAIPFERSKLPRNWKADPAPAALQAIGDSWVLSGRSPVLQLPSVIVPNESNFLLNVRHPDFARLRFGKSIPFALDVRFTAARAERRKRGHPSHNRIRDHHRQRMNEHAVA